VWEITYFTIQTSASVEVTHIQQTWIDTPQLPETRDIEMRPPSLKTRTWPTHHVGNELLKPKPPNISTRKTNTHTSRSTIAPKRPQRTNIPGGGEPLPVSREPTTWATSYSTRTYHVGNFLFRTNLSIGKLPAPHELIARGASFFART